MSYLNQTLQSISLTNPNKGEKQTVQIQPGQTFGTIKPMLSVPQGTSFFLQDPNGHQQPVNDNTPLVDGQNFIAVPMTKAGA